MNLAHLGLASFVEWAGTMSVPRQILPGRFYKVTRRCTQQQFLLRPDDETNNAFTYCLAEAAERFDIDVIATSVQSNHHHTDVFDRHGHIIEFVEHFHKMTARCLNALRGRWENFWSSGEVHADRDRKLSAASCAGFAGPRASRARVVSCRRGPAVTRADRALPRDDAGGAVAAGRGAVLDRAPPPPCARAGATPHLDRGPGRRARPQDLRPCCYLA